MVTNVVIRIRIAKSSVEQSTLPIET